MAIKLTLDSRKHRPLMDGVIQADAMATVASWWTMGFAWLNHLSVDWRQVVQIGALLLLAYGGYSLLARRSRSARLLKGVLLVLGGLLALLSVALYFRLTLLITLFGFTIQIVVFAVIVIFQPELRRLLSYLGQSRFWEKSILEVPTMMDSDTSSVLEDLVRSVRFLSKSKTGALIVLESPDGGGEHYLESGVQIGGRVSTELLLTIFHPKTPLHDGAVVVDRFHRVASAGVLLPLTENPKLSWQYGTRHRAAIGLTELSSSRCVVVSEETGQISWVAEGQLEKQPNIEALQEKLAQYYQVSSPSSSGVVTSLLKILPEKMTPRPLREQVQQWFQSKH